MKAKRVRNIAIAAMLLVVAILGGLIAYNFIIPSIVTEVAVTGVPTARGDNLAPIRTQAAARTQTAAAVTTTPTNAVYIPERQDDVTFASFAGAPQPIRVAQDAPLYTSCTSARGATATPSGQAAATPEATATMEPTPAATPSGEPNFVLLSIVGDESEACYQVGEILRGNYVLAVGVTKSIAGEVAIDLNNVANSQIGEEININISEIKSDQPNRDRWMISAQGFNFNEFPIAKLTNAKLEGLPARAYTEGEMLSFTVTGDMQLKDKTFPTTFTAMGKYENGVLVVSAYVDLKLSEIGLFPPDLGFVRVNDDVRIVLNLVARAQ